jgi:membrane protease YdiL (CAAX protease family)
MKGQSARRASALLEVLGIAAAGPLVMWGVRQLFGISIINPLSTLRSDVTDAQLLMASGQMFKLLVFQYGGYFLLIIPLTLWRRKRGLSAFGLSASGQSWRALISNAGATAAIAAWAVIAVSLLNSLHPSETAPWRQALIDMSERRWEFWLFTGVMSWALIPVLEELFYRGYALRRLAEDWGGGAAIVGSACLFTFGHSQYLVLSPYNVAVVTSLLAFAIAVGVAFVWSRSLVPCIAAHVLINFPLVPLWQGVLLVVLLAAVVIAWRHAFAAAKQVFRLVRPSTVLVLSIVVIAFDAVMAQDSIWIYGIASGFLVSAIVLEGVQRRRKRVLSIAT